jgi:hypothetical protein
LASRPAHGQTEREDSRAAREKRAASREKARSKSRSPAAQPQGRRFEEDKGQAGSNGGDARSAVGQDQVEARSKDAHDHKHHKGKKRKHEHKSKDKRKAKKRRSNNEADDAVSICMWRTGCGPLHCSGHSDRVANMERGY